MTRLLLSIASILFCTIGEPAIGQVRFEPGIIEFDNYSCTIDTTFETLLINDGDEPETTSLYFKVSLNLTILEGPEGWVGGAPTTIQPHDTLRFVVRMQGRPRDRTASMQFKGPSFAQFSIRATIRSEGVIVTRSGTDFTNMRVGETRSETLTIHNPSDETRSVKAYFIVPIDGWEITGLPEYTQIPARDSAHFVATFTATKPGTFSGSAGVRDECGGIDYFFKATVLPEMGVESAVALNVGLLIRDRTIVVEGRVGARITLTDLAGRTHYSAEAEETMHEVDLSDIPSGAYFLRVSDGVNTQTRKLVIP